MRKQAMIVCGENMSAGIKIYNFETGEELLRIPTCASSSHGLICISNRFLVASQLQKHRPFGGGAIFFWNLNKPQTQIRSYPLEAIGPIASTRDGIYLAGGAPSGNMYIWDVMSGQLLKSWSAHQSSITCLAFSEDDSLLISGSEDGTISIWLMISLLNMEDNHADRSLSLDAQEQHVSSITNLLLLTGGSSPSLISSSLDGTFKVWNIYSGQLRKTHIFPVALTSIAVEPGEQHLFAGNTDGGIHAAELGIGLEDNVSVVLEDYSGVLTGHKEAITALAFSLEGHMLISASKDCTICIWNVKAWQIIRKFSQRKGYVTNILVVPQPILTVMENHRSCACSRISLLDKTPQMSAASDNVLTILPACSSQKDDAVTPHFQTSELLKKQIVELEREETPEAIQMKAETAVENRLWIISTAKHMITINKHLQSRLLDMIQYRA